MKHLADLTYAYLNTHNYGQFEQFIKNNYPEVKGVDLVDVYFMFNTIYQHGYGKAVDRYAV